MGGWVDGRLDGWAVGGRVLLRVNEIKGIKRKRPEGKRGKFIKNCDWAAIMAAQNQ